MANAYGFISPGTDFQEKVLLNAPIYARMATSLGLTDFNPLTVDWTSPVSWGNDPVTCDSINMKTSDGCMMPLGAGLCARLSRALHVPTVLTGAPYRCAVALSLGSACSSRL